MDKVSAYQAVIGPVNQNYYLSYFRRAEERGYAPLSWNWAALFLGLFWLLWRRQYRWALFTLALGFATSVIAGIIAEQTGSQDMGKVASYILSIPYLGIYLPLKANGIYYQWCKQTIATAQSSVDESDEAQQTWLATKGGVHKNLPLIIALGFTALLLLIGLAGPAPELPPG